MMGGVPLTEERKDALVAAVPGSRENLTERAYQVLRQRILSHVIAPGEAINDTALAQELGMSRTPVREGLLALQQRGLVRIVPRVGHFASEITSADVFEAYEVRMLLEPAAAEMAAQRITPAEAEALRPLVGYGPEEITPDLFARAVDLNRQFHVGIAEVTHNHRLVQLYSQLMDDLTRVVYYELHQGLTSGAWRDEHLAILDALARHDVEEAGRLMREDILETHVLVQEGVWLRYRDLLEHRRPLRLT
jgi:GntR family transcriptional regulator, rspAB operon transcriptional repressor